MRSLVVPFVLLCAFPTGVRAQDVPSVATIRSHIAAAEGPRWPAEHLVITSTVAGVSGTETGLRSGDSFVERTVAGPFETAEGEYDGQGWRQTENGVTVLVQEDPGNERAPGRKTSVRPTTTPVAGYAIEALDAEHHGTREFVDAATWRVVREEHVSATGTSATVYDDFRTVAGRSQAWHWTTSDGHPENAAEYRISSDTPDAVDDALLKIPAFRRNLIDFPPGLVRADLPVRMEHGRLYVRVMVGQRGLDFLLDSGADGITLDSDVAASLGIKTYTQGSIVTAARHALSRAIVPEMRVGPFAMHDVAVAVLPPLGRESLSAKVVGLLGFDFIGQCPFKIDYVNGTLTAYAPQTFLQPADPAMVPLEVRLGTGTPQTTVIVNGATADRFTIDTGADGTLFLFDYFARRYPEALARGSVQDQAYFSGVGGSVSVKSYNFHTIQIGSVNLEDFEGYLMPQGSYDYTSDGLLGTGFLRLYDVWLDYAESRVFLVPNAVGKKIMR